MLDLLQPPLLQGNNKMNLLFVAELFNKYPCLAPLTQEETLEVEATATDMLDFNDEGTREERGVQAVYGVQQ